MPHPDRSLSWYSILKPELGQAVLEVTFRSGALSGSHGFQAVISGVQGIVAAQTYGVYKSSSADRHLHVRLGDSEGQARRASRASTSSCNRGPRVAYSDADSRGQGGWLLRVPETRSAARRSSVPCRRSRFANWGEASNNAVAACSLDSEARGGSLA